MQTHIKVTGIPCGSPPLRGEQFCYFHQHTHRGVRNPPQSRLHPIAIFEDEESIQASLMEVVNALMRNTIDLKRAELILRALHIAVKNARRVKFAASATSMIKEVPDYPEPPAAEPEHAEVDRPPHTVAEILESRAAIAAAYYGSNEKPQATTETPTAEIASVGADAFVRPGGEAAVSRHVPGSNVKVASNHVGTAAPGCPGGPEVSGRSAVAATTLRVGTDTFVRSGGEAAAPDPSKKKPPVNVKAAPKERKIAAHRVSRG